MSPLVQREPVLVKSATVGLVGFALVGAVGGATGWLKSEYPLPPHLQALFVAFLLGTLGYLLGLGVGLACEFWRRR